MTYRVAVLDDDTRELHRTAEMLSFYGERRRQFGLEITYFQEVKPFMEAVSCKDGKGKWAFDVLLMDVYLPDGDGIESAGLLREKGYEGVIIFKSSLREDALRAYSIRALHYLVKPVSQEKLDGAMDKAVKEIRRRVEKQEDAEQNVPFFSGGPSALEKETGSGKPEVFRPLGYRIKEIFIKRNGRPGRREG